MSNLKVGDKVQLIKNTDGFKQGQVVVVFELCSDGVHLFKGVNSMFNFCDGLEGAYLCTDEYIVLPSTPAHPHADLMLKYAQIAQYDDKPWEQFERAARAHRPRWNQCDSEMCFYSNLKYRLKPQPPVVQIGQTWVSPEGIPVQVQAVLPGSSTVKFNYLVGGVNQVQCMNTNVFSKVFKRKE